MTVLALLLSCTRSTDEGPGPVDSGLDSAADSGLEPLERQTGEERLGGEAWTGEAGDALGAVAHVAGTPWLAAAQRDDGVGAVCHAGDDGPVEPCWTGRTNRGFLGNAVVAYEGRLAAAAFWDSTGGSWAGSVFLLDDAGGSVDEAPVTWQGDGGDYAGSSLAVGDLDGDGADELVIGGFAGGGLSRGEVWLVDDAGGELSGASRRIQGSYEEGWFGISTATGDADGDGLEDLLAGAMGEDSGAGAAYLFLGPVEGVLASADADVRLHGSTAYGYVGKSVDLGDLDGDGLDDLCVAESDVDRVHLVLGPGADASVEDLEVGVTGSGRFGFDLRCRDLDRDGFADLAVGASRFEETGAAFVFYGPLSGQVSHEDADWTLLGEAVGDKAGLTVEIHAHELFVGASGPAEGAGRVYRP